MLRRGGTTPSEAMQLTEEVFLRLAERGYKEHIVSVEHVRHLQEEIEGNYKQSLLDKEFYQERLAYFDFRIPDNL